MLPNKREIAVDYLRSYRDQGDQMILRPLGVYFILVVAVVSHGVI